MNLKAWEVHEDGTLTPVTVLARMVFPGSVRVERADGSIAGLQYRNLVSHATGERLTLAELHREEATT